MKTAPLTQGFLDLFNILRDIKATAIIASDSNT